MRTRDNKYRDYVKGVLKNSQSVSFINLTPIGGKAGEFLRIQAVTYGVDNGQVTDNVVDELDVWINDGKRRHAKTLQKFGVTKEEFDGFTPASDAAVTVSNYFIKHDDTLVITKLADKNNVNKFLNEYKCYTLNTDNIIRMDTMAEDCMKKLPEFPDIDAQLKCFRYYFEKYERSETKELNRIDCAVECAWYWESNEHFPIRWILCKTSIGRVYYDTARRRWGITEKERKKNGFKIEMIDIDSIEQQLFEKYKVESMFELQKKLMKKNKEAA